MILVTGGTGLLGAYLLLELTRKGNKVRALRREHSSLRVVENIFRYNDNHAEELKLSGLMEISVISIHSKMPWKALNMYITVLLWSHSIQKIAIR